MSEGGLHRVPELPPNSDIKVSVKSELHFYTGKDVLEN